MQRSVLLAAVALAAAAAGVGLWLGFGARGDAMAACRSDGTGGLVGASIGGPFTLIDETGAEARSADLIDRPTLLYFGYTFCPDFCPTDAANMADAAVLLEERGIDLRTLFVTIDPERDDPAALRDFTDAMHPDMIGLTGSPEAIAEAAKAWRVYYAKVDEGDPKYYIMDHSTFTYLVFPEHGFVDFFRHDADAEKIADTVSCYVSAGS